MIQRIQTIHLLVVAARLAVTLFAPLAWFAGASGEFALHAFALRSGGEAVQPTLYLGISLVLACLVPLVTIFLVRNRMLQLRLCAVEAVLLVGAVVMEAVHYYLSRRVFAAESFHTQGFEPAVALPLVALLFVWLAARAIFRDEVMVRAADRIR